MTIPPVHVPVLLEETMRHLGVRPAGRYLDCTTGLGGHSTA
ncbi:MAG: 16S rRNA (cytosine(1402)-N(4))-methyltransferase, partial [Tepidiformaceae bacterium]